jgi:hypothetical protein
VGSAQTGKGYPIEFGRHEKSFPVWPDERYSLIPKMAVKHLPISRHINPSGLIPYLDLPTRTQWIIDTLPIRQNAINPAVESQRS